jgi:hypothetical protein
MNRKSSRFFIWQPWLLLIIVLVWATALPARADIGPKPEMTFNFVYAGERISIISGELLECNEPDCSDGRPLEEAGPQRFECPTNEPDVCRAMAYGFRPYHRLVIQFADGTRESDVFQKHAFNETFTVTVQATSLEVRPHSRSLSRGFGPALLVTLLVELIVAALYLLLFRMPRAMLLWALLASLITLPIVWFMLATLAIPALLLICGYELFAVVVEAVVLYVGGRKYRFALKHAAVLSILMNFASYIVGVLLIR